MNDSDESKRNVAIKKWTSRIAQYKAEFAMLSPKISTRFLREFERRGELHDYTIEGISYSCRRQKSVCKLYLRNKNESVVLEMQRVNSVSVQINSYANCILGNLTWGYCEFSNGSSNSLQLSVICDLDNELVFEFDKVAFSNR